MAPLYLTSYIYETDKRSLRDSWMPGLRRLRARSIQGAVPQPFSASSAVLSSLFEGSPDAMVKCAFHQILQSLTETCTVLIDRQM